MTTSRGARTKPIARIKRTASVVALAGGLLTALAYWLLPVATVPLVGSLTAPSLVGQIADPGSIGLLYLAPVTSLITILLAVWGLVGHLAGRARQLVSAVILLCAVLSAAAYLIPLGTVDNAITSSGASELGIRATTFTGIGFWLAVVGAVVCGVGAIIELSGIQRRDGRATA
jgi:hypothetical protein